MYGNAIREEGRGFAGGVNCASAVVLIKIDTLYNYNLSMEATVLRINIYSWLTIPRFGHVYCKRPSNSILRSTKYIQESIFGWTWRKYQFLQSSRLNHGQASVGLYPLVAIDERCSGDLWAMSDAEAIACSDRRARHCGSGSHCNVTKRARDQEQKLAMKLQLADNQK
jgi:hypothetical protein